MKYSITYFITIVLSIIGMQACNQIDKQENDSASTTEMKHANYHCPDHCGNGTYHKAGKCPVCKKNLVKEEIHEDHYHDVDPHDGDHHEHAKDSGLHHEKNEHHEDRDH